MITLRQSLTLILIMFVGVTALLTNTSAPPHFALAQGDGEEVAYHCANLDLWVRACPQWSCDPLFMYSPGTLMFVHDMVQGDREAGSDEWLVIRDPVQQVEGYIHSTQALTCEPQEWMTRPVVPEVSDAAIEIYQRGLDSGNDPDHFAKVGDCQNVTAYYLAHFDRPLEYDLGNFNELQSTIQHFAGSFERESAAVEGGYTVASVLSPMWSDPDRCEPGETPLECEERLYNPSIVIISMETWNRTNQQPADVYEDYLSRVVEFWIEQGAVPIVATKADNLEGDHSINAAVARVADTYDIPLWNFWLAAQSLPGGGFEDPIDDRFHLHWARSFYNNPDRLRDGWPVRNLTALQAINAVWQAVNGADAPGAANSTASGEDGS